MSNPDLGLDVQVGITRDGRGLKVGLQVSGGGRTAAVCMTAKSARIYADALRTAADRLEEMLEREGKTRTITDEGEDGP